MSTMTQPDSDTAERAFSLQLLDRFTVAQRRRPIDIPAGCQRLLALLALRGPRSRSATAGTLWPEAGEDRAHGNLRSTVWRLRRSLPGVLAGRGQALALNADLEIDTVEFAMRMRRLADDNGPVGSDDASESFTRVHELLPDWEEEWVSIERERLRQLNLHALESLSVRLLRQGRHCLAMEAAMLVVAAEPLRESAHRAVISVHLAEGNLAEARGHYLAMRETFLRELGVPPTGETRRLIGC